MAFIDNDFVSDLIKKMKEMNATMMKLSLHNCSGLDDLCVEINIKDHSDCPSDDDSN